MNFVNRHSCYGIPFHKEQSGSLFWTLAIALSEDNVLVLLDFAENYSFLIQEAIQGYHWNNSQATLHPFVVYRKDKQILTVKSLCMISDHMKQDSNAVHDFLGKVLNLFYWKIVGSHHNNAFMSVMVPAHYTRTTKILLIFAQLAAELMFFTLSHRKSPCDRIWGTAKHLVANASLQSLKEPIYIPEKTFL